MSALTVEQSDVADSTEYLLFAAIAQDLYAKGYSVQENALADVLAEQLWRHLQAMPQQKFKPAGVGRAKEFVLNNSVRSDAVSWITGESEACAAWLAWAASLQCYLNRRLLLGLFSFESHFAHYSRGDFYKKHKDAFIGEANRRVSIVLYLNPDWQPSDGGELVIYSEDASFEAITVAPNFATIVAFLSEDFPHEVLPALRDRYSIAGWFRVNGTSKDKVDPPR